VENHDVANCLLWRYTTKLVVGLLSLFGQLDRHTWLLNFLIVNGRYQSNRRNAAKLGNNPAFGIMIFHCRGKLGRPYFFVVAHDVALNV